MTANTRPAGAKVPQDRKPPKPTDNGDGTLTVTVRGAEYTVDRDNLDDYEVMENLSDGNFIPALRAILSPEQIDAVKASLRDPETKRVKASAMGEFVAELIGALNPNS